MRTLLAICCAALVAQSGFGYVRRNAEGTTTPIYRTDIGGIQYYVSNQIKAGQMSTGSGASVKVITDNSDPVSAIQASLAAWNSLPGSTLKFLPLKATIALHDTEDQLMTIAFSRTEDASLVGGAIAVTAVFYALGSGVLPNGVSVGGAGEIYDADIILNSALTFSTDASSPNDIQGVVTHEIGHALGLDHSTLMAATMFPFASINGQAQLSQRLLSGDERAFAAAAFPTSAEAAGTFSGTVKMSGAPVKTAVITMMDTSTGTALGTFSGIDGSWSLRVPPGNYTIYAEPFNGIVGPRNFYSIDPNQVTTGFQPGFLSGDMSIAAGAKVTVPEITVTAATAGLTTPFMTTGKAGGVGDILNGLRTPDSPLVTASGQTFDIAFLGGGVDATTIPQVMGTGMAIRPNTIRVDPAKFNDGPLLRATIDVISREAPGTGTLILKKGANTLVYSGLFVIVPPKPAFTSASVVSSADGRLDPVVSPGGLCTIYANTGATVGPATGVVLSNYDAYGKVSSLLGGVSVSFDGISAPVFYSGSGQINVQVPFELAGRSSAMVQINFNGSISDAIKVTVAESQPAFFGYGADNTIVVNKDNAFNTATNPVVRGDYVTFYGTGIGTGTGSYQVRTGLPTPNPPSGYSGNSTCVMNGSKTVPVAYAGWTPTATGLAQWTVIIPQDAPTGKVSVKCTDPHGASTPAGTLYIK